MTTTSPLHSHPHDGPHDVTIDSRAGAADPAPFTATLRSEAIKLTSLRSTGFTLVALFVVGVAFGVISALSAHASWPNIGAAERATFDPTNASFYGLYLAQLAIGVLGALCITGEIATGTLTPTLLATPRRGRLLAAKVIAFGAVALVVGELTSFASFGITQALLEPPVPVAHLGDPGVLRAVVLTGAYVPLAGLLALGLGVIVRSTAGAVAAFGGVVLVVSFLIAPLPEGIVNTLLPLTPGGILTTFMAPASPPPHSLDPWVACAVLAAEVAVTLGVGAVRFIRRDA